MTHLSSVTCPRKISEGVARENAVCGSESVSSWRWWRLTFRQRLCPLCAWERKSKRGVIRGQVTPCTGKTCLKDRRFPWVSIQNSFFKVVSLRATGFAALLNFTRVQPAKARDVYSAPNSLPTSFSALLPLPASNTVWQRLRSYRLPAFHAAFSDPFLHLHVDPGTLTVS